MINLLHTQEIEKTFVFAKQKHYEASPKQKNQRSRVDKIKKDPDVELLCIKKELQKSFQKFCKKLVHTPKSPFMIS